MILILPEMKDNIRLLILTPERTLAETDVEKVTLPGVKGRFMVLKNHAPLISSLEEGDVIYVSAGNEVVIHVLSGFVEINDNKVTVCVEI